MEGGALWKRYFLTLPFLGALTEFAWHEGKIPLHPRSFFFIKIDIKKGVFFIFLALLGSLTLRGHSDLYLTWIKNIPPLFLYIKLIILMYLKIKGGEGVFSGRNELYWSLLVNNIMWTTTSAMQKKFSFCCCMFDFITTFDSINILEQISASKI